MRKQFTVNLICQVLVFVFNLIINFLMTPYMLQKLGSEAYGFIGLVNNFISYLSVVTIALNSLAGRYITISFHRNESEKCEEYYSSVFLPMFFYLFVYLRHRIY